MFLADEMTLLLFKNCSIVVDGMLSIAVAEILI
jgi:hypothetical protein